MIISAGIIPHSPFYLPIKEGVATAFGPVRDATRALVQTWKRSAPDCIIMLASGADDSAIALNQAATVELSFNDLVGGFGSTTITTDVALTAQLRHVGHGKTPIVLQHNPVETSHAWLSILPLIEIGVPFVLVSLPSTLSFDDALSLGKAWREIVETQRRRAIVVMSGVLSQTVSKRSPLGYSSRGAEFDSLYRSLWLAGDLTPLHDASLDMLQHAKSTVVTPSFVFDGMIGEHDAKPQILAYDDSYGVGYLVGKWW